LRVEKKGEKELRDRMDIFVRESAGGTPKKRMLNSFRLITTRLETEELPASVLGRG